MSEQKYYVKSRPEIMYYSSYDGFESTIYTDFWLNKSGIFVPTIDRDKITKSELAEMMDSVFYKHKFRTETQDELFNNGWGIRKDKVDGCVHWEWINPLIELVPVEEEDVSN